MNKCASGLWALVAGATYSVTGCAYFECLRGREQSTPTVKSISPCSFDQGRSGGEYAAEQAPPVMAVVQAPGNGSRSRLTFNVCVNLTCILCKSLNLQSQHFCHRHPLPRVEAAMDGTSTVRTLRAVDHPSALQRRAGPLLL